VEERSLSVRVDDQGQGFSRDAALIALAQARDQFDGHLRLDRLVRPEPTSDENSRTSGAVETSPSVLGANPVKPPQGAAQAGLSIWGLLGLGALVPVGVVILAWHFLYRQLTVAPVSSSSVSTSSVSKELAAKSASFGTLEAIAVPANARGHQTVTAAPLAASPRLDPAQSVAMMARQLADAEQEIDKLKALKAQTIIENSELDKRLKEAQELVRGDADLIKDLKAAQSRMTQDNADLAAQLKASQEQVTNLAAQLDASQTQTAKIAAQIKASQDQITRLVEQKQRSKRLISASLPASSPTRKPAPRPQLQRTQPQTGNPAPHPP
jgi:septal ring factor EnvC (AmiA/AmiB activator)